MKQYEKIMKDNKASEWSDMEDGLYHHNIKADSTTHRYEEDLQAIVLNDGQTLPCNLCGAEVLNILCLHYTHEWESKVGEENHSDISEEEILLCEECTRKLAKLYDEV